MAKQNGKQKMGARHLKAMARQGLAELRGALYTQSNVAQPTAYGIYGNPLPSEIANDHKGGEKEQDTKQPSKLDERLAEIDREPPAEPEPPEPERD